ncbi:non-hydrolyzing UDP-N-acetylglucosamine 2-epimerase [Arundinibacter roseus]|uniref:UDP-N-acetylglucosamine 2-epimerase (non-hydrolyzing) n=1 Tax=Arundinibacter roseus TaxID=2070510 RepID=A0A4R4K7B3_9BACT|nr:UDP-N-acetylglucosamine 2-epimerase (non-hydrolyzing) [Arundinibacter roseus]TDB63474.1 UDP-N-acetylglucosamine 2-epimerase (non-hydrolyzing) [Arundinibacter roseus]
MKILTVIGTRPEAIKMAPLIRLLNQTPEFEHKLCSTGQHRQMLAQVMDFFEIEADFDLDIMQPGQDLTDITCRILQGMRQVLADFQPDWVLVHGDTTTCLAATLAAFYAGIKVGHVEAGLRTGNLQAPFPEEANRLLVDRLATAYFAPTQRNVDNLLKEGVSADRIVQTGNTVIDALLWATNKVRGFSLKVPKAVQEAFTLDRRVLLVTGHRRENFGEGFEQITEAIRVLATTYPELAIVYPVHLNPNVQQPVQARLTEIPNVYLTAPFEYPDFIFAMKHSWLILTDSGGVQEEAPSLGKPVLVMRDTTERPEAVEAGTVQLVGAHRERIVAAVQQMWQNHLATVPVNPYGDGFASQRIVSFLSQAPSFL